MGQRFQAYAVLPKCSCAGRWPERVPPLMLGSTDKTPAVCPECQGAMKGRRVVGLHHQWLYGPAAVRRARNFLNVITQSISTLRETIASRDRAQDLLNAAFSTDFESGISERISPFIEDDGRPYFSVLDDPRNGDNNDGIVIFDLRKAAKRGSKAQGLDEERVDPESISYAFMRFEHFEGGGGVVLAQDLPTFSPIEARIYAACYDDGIFQAPTLRNGALNQGELWVREFEALGVPLLTKAAIKSCFPAMFRAQKAEAA